MLAAFLSLAISSAPGYGDARAKLDGGLEIAKQGTPEQVIERLPAAIEGISDYPMELGRDPEALERRDLAMVALAFAHFSLEDEDAAILVVDESIRSAGPRELPARPCPPRSASGRHSTQVR